MPLPPSSIRKLYQKLAATTEKPAWIALCPTSSVHVMAWRGDYPIAPVDPIRAAAAAMAVPLGGHATTRRAVWAGAFSAALLGDGGDYAVYCYGRVGLPVAIAGWRIYRLDELRSRMLAVGGALRSVHATAMLQTEASALRHVLERANSCVVTTRLEGEIIGASPSAKEFLGHLAYGPRHNFRRESAPLPPSLVGAMAQAPEGQRRLSGESTARFQRLNALGAEWSPLVEVEFFAEKPTSSGVRLSSLTPVEREVLDLLVQGATNPAIARHRGVAPSTVKNQVAEILRKTGLARRTELIAAHHHRPFEVGTVPRLVIASTR